MGTRGSRENDEAVENLAVDIDDANSSSNALNSPHKLHSNSEKVRKLITPFFLFCFVLFMWWAGNCSITESLPELITGAPEARFNIYTRCTSNGSVQTVLYLQYGTSSKVPDSYAYQSLFIVP